MSFLLDLADTAFDRMGRRGWFLTTITVVTFFFTRQWWSVGLSFLAAIAAFLVGTSLLCFHYVIKTANEQKKTKTTVNKATARKAAKPKQHTPPPQRARANRDKPQKRDLKEL